MRSIFKYDVHPVLARIKLRVRGLDTRIAHVQAQKGRIHLWVGVDDAAPEGLWMFSWNGTGVARENDMIPEQAVYVGTVLLDDDQLVLHGFLHRIEASA